MTVAAYTILYAAVLAPLGRWTRHQWTTSPGNRPGKHTTGEATA